MTSEFEPRISGCGRNGKKESDFVIIAKNGCEVDVSLGLPGYEEELIKRVVPFKLGRGKSVIISAEDLISIKLLLAALKT